MDMDMDKTRSRMQQLQSEIDTRQDEMNMLKANIKWPRDNRVRIDGDGDLVLGTEYVRDSEIKDFSEWISSYVESLEQKGEA